MPNGKVHAVVGATSGVGIALLRTRSDDLIGLIAELIGGGLGGYVGGRLPDLVEPANTPVHRSMAHSLAAAGAGTWALSSLKGWEDNCRARATRARQAANRREGDQLDWFIWLFNVIQQLFWHAAAGFTAGAAGGYLSHLALDAFTPKGLPLLTG